MSHVTVTLLGCILPFGVFGIGPAIAYIADAAIRRRR